MMLADAFLWLKAAHVISVVAWMAGLFYLPRLFVYHAESAVGGAVSEQFKIMERRLAWGIMFPAGVSSWVFGAATLISGGYAGNMPSWLAAKLVLVILLSGFHLLLHHYMAAFADDGRPGNSRYFRLLNEFPTLVLVAVVILVVVRPF